MNNAQRKQELKDLYAKKNKTEKEIKDVQD